MLTVNGVIVIVLVLMLVLLLLRVPAAVSLGLSGALGLVALRGINHTTNVLGAEPIAETATYSLTIIPMFILIDMFAVRANVASYVFTIADRVLGRSRGGLCFSAVAASVGVSAVSG